MPEPHDEPLKKIPEPGHALGASLTDIEDRDLRLEVFAICDSANEFDGRLNILGTYEALEASEFPFILPTAAVVLRIRLWPMEGDQHKFRIGIASPDGKPLLKALEFDGTTKNRFPDRSFSFNVIVTLSNICFREAGEYLVDFHLDGVLEGRLPLLVLAK